MIVYFNNEELVTFDNTGGLDPEAIRSEIVKLKPEIAAANYTLDTASDSLHFFVKEKELGC